MTDDIDDAAYAALADADRAELDRLLNIRDVYGSAAFEKAGIASFKADSARYARFAAVCRPSAQWTEKAWVMMASIGLYPDDFHGKTEAEAVSMIEEAALRAWTPKLRLVE